MAQQNPRTRRTNEEVGQRQMRFGEETFRLPSKVVAIIDIFLSSLLVFVLGLAVLAIAIIGPEILKGVKAKHTEFQKMPRGILFAIIVIYLIMHIIFALIQVWVGLQLFSATQVSTPLPESVRKAKLWRNFKFAFLVLDLIMLVVSSGSSLNSTWDVMWLLLKAAQVAVVHTFIDELQSQIVDQN